MIRLDTKAGHGAGKPTSKSIEEYTDIFCFLIRALGIQYRQEEGGVPVAPCSCWTDPSG